jgi:hypothetical protein
MLSADIYCLHVYMSWFSSVIVHSLLHVLISGLMQFQLCRRILEVDHLNNMLQSSKTFSHLMLLTQRFFIFVPKMYTLCYFLHGHFFIQLPYILKSSLHPFSSFRGLKNQMWIRFAVESWTLEKWYSHCTCRKKNTMQYNHLLSYLLL